MPSSNNVHIAPFGRQIRALHASLIEIVSVFNRPQRDEAMMKLAGIRLDRALFPLLVGIGRLGPIGVVEAADRLGRDYTTVSRQIAKLESLGLVERRQSAADRRVRHLAITRNGKAMTDRVDAERLRIGAAIFAGWEPRDVDELVRLVGKFADAITDPPEIAQIERRGKGKRTTSATSSRP